MPAEIVGDDIVGRRAAAFDRVEKLDRGFEPRAGGQDRSPLN
jgi:hypothetical protein